MKVVKASLAQPGDTGRIIYVSLAEAVLLKGLLCSVMGSSTTSLRTLTVAMAGQLSDSDVYLNGPELFTTTIHCAENSLNRLQENVNENNH